MNGNLLEISYDRVISSEEVILTTDNCTQYGYVATTAEIGGKTYTVFYEIGDKEENYKLPEIKDGVATTKITLETKKKYTHIAPPCSSYDFTYADVDKEGSGRSELTGEMFRERIGNYCSLSVAWNLIPKTKEYNNWYTVLTHLPPKVELKMLFPSGETKKMEMYRGDINTKLYLFVKDTQIWQGLSTTFTQWDVEAYDDTIEPSLMEV